MSDKQMVFFWTNNGHGWCEKFSREKAYHYDKGRKLVKNFLQNLKLNWLNFTILLSDFAEGISIL
jgi:hypothetical protein